MGQRHPGSACLLHPFTGWQVKCRGPLRSLPACIHDPSPPLTAGEEPHSGIVASISSGNPALVTCIDDERLEFQVGEGGRRVARAMRRQLYCVPWALLCCC